MLKFPHPENKLPGYNFVPESFTNLGNTKRNFHPAGFLHVQEIHKYALGRFGAQVNGTGIFGYGTNLRRKHQIKLAYFGPVGGAGNRAFNIFGNN